MNYTLIATDATPKYEKQPYRLESRSLPIYILVYD